MAAGSRFFSSNAACGEIAGTGSLINVQLTFQPITVIINNRTRNSNAIWSQAMPAASAQKTITSGAGTTDISFITTNGITAGSQGFALGTDAGLNQNMDVIYWEAFGR